MAKITKNFILIILIFKSVVFPSNEKAVVDSVNNFDYLFIVSNLRKSEKMFSENLDLAKSIDYKYGEAKALSNLALSYYLNGQYEKATSAYLSAINIFEEIDDKIEFANTLGEFGYQLKRRDLNKASYYMQQGIRIAEENSFDSLLSKLYNNYGVIKEMEGNLDSALFYYQSSLEKVYEMDITMGIPYGLNKIAGISAMKGDYEKAIGLLKESDKYREKEEGNFGKAENLGLYGDVYRTMGNYDEAIQYYQKCLDLSLKGEINYLIRYCYEQLTELYRKTGNYEKALESLTFFNEYKDSVINEQVQTNLAELELDYQTEKKDRIIAESQLELSQRNAQLYLSIGIILLLAVSSFSIYKAQKRKRENERKEMELNNKLKHAEFENKISEEKIRISRELHDNIGSQLTFMISSIDNYTYKINEGKDAQKLNNISNFGRETLKELRNTIWALKNEDASLNHLVVKINELVNQINANIDSIDIKVNNNVNNPTKLSAVQMLNLFRITQEAIQNSIKHACSRNIIIEFIETDGKINLTIKDDGKGFVTEEAFNGNGLANMKERCIEAKGRFDVKSSSQGTEINCLIAGK